MEQSYTDTLDQLFNHITVLQEEINSLNDKILDANQHTNYCKQRELIEFVKDINTSIDMELNDIDSTRTKTDVLNNLKNYVQEFIKNNKIR